MAVMKKNSYPVKDATSDLVLTIKPNDIAHAERKDNTACAEAHALCRQAGYREARVYRNVTYVRLGDGSWLRFRTPKDLYIEIMIFDRGGTMEAGEYKFTAPKGVYRLGHHAKPTGKKRRTGRKLSPHIVKNVRETAPKGKNHLAALFE